MSEILSYARLFTLRGHVLNISLMNENQEFSQYTNSARLRIDSVAAIKYLYHNGAVPVSFEPLIREEYARICSKTTIGHHEKLP